MATSCYLPLRLLAGWCFVSAGMVSTELSEQALLLHRMLPGHEAHDIGDTWLAVVGVRLLSPTLATARRIEGWVPFSFVQRIV
ncbi:hypothetical protein V2G26_014432 [Clonostachys chloroleuca]